MATSKKFSQLPAASSVGNGDLFAIAHEDALAETGYVSQKLTTAQAGQKVNGDTEYPTGLPSFPTGSQNPFDALEKLNADIEALYPVNTASGSIANFTTSLAKPLVALSSTIVAQQSGSGTPSPSNPRSISGFSSVKFVRCGKNLFDKNNLIDGKAISSDGSITDSTYAKLTDYIPITNGQCTFSAVHKTGTTALRLGLYDENKTFISRSISTVGAEGSLTTLTINNSNVKFVRANLYTTGENVDTAQVELGTTATSYEAYTGNTFTIALGQTVYGGVVDCKNGKLRITFGIVNLSDYANSFSRNNPQQNPNGTVFSLSLDVIFKGWNDGGSDTAFSNCLIKSSSASFVTGDSNSFYWTSTRTGYRVTFGTDQSTTLEQFKDYLANNDMLICGELYEPIEIDITSNNFTTLVGENNIFTDCGEVTVSFKQSIQEYIDAQIATTQALIL